MFLLHFFLLEYLKSFLYILLHNQNRMLNIYYFHFHSQLLIPHIFLLKLCFEPLNLADCEYYFFLFPILSCYPKLYFRVATIFLLFLLLFIIAKITNKNSITNIKNAFTYFSLKLNILKTPYVLFYIILCLIFIFSTKSHLEQFPNGIL